MTKARECIEKETHRVLSYLGPTSLEIILSSCNSTILEKYQDEVSAVKPSLNVG